MTLEKAVKIADRICYGAEDCPACPFCIYDGGANVCAYDRVYDVIYAEEEKEVGYCKVILPTTNNTLEIREEDMDAVMEEITAYRRRKEK